MRERLRVLRHRDFRNLWLAQTTSAMGDGVVVVALALFVTDLTDSPTTSESSCSRSSCRWSRSS